MAVKILLFGGFRIVAEGGCPAPSLPRKAQLCLARLLVHRGREFSRAYLAGLLWPELEESRARRNLSNLIWKIRRELEPALGLPAPLLITRRDSVAFNPECPCFVDVEEFERLVEKGDEASLRAAVDLYRDEFLPGFYEDWVLARREWLRDRYFSALRDLVRILQERGDYLEALRYAQLLVNYDPLREDFQRELMRLYWLTGRHHAAIRQYERLKEVLAQELQTEPSPSTQKLYRQILSSLKRSEVRRASPGIGWERLPMVGREKERAELLGYIEAAETGAGGVMLVEGEAGVGKTRLLREVSEGATWRGVEVLWGWCNETGLCSPYAPLKRALGKAISPLRVEQFSRLLGIPDLRKLAVILPELERHLPGETPSVPRLPHPREKTRLLEIFSRFVLGLGEIAPHLLIIEDLQWADADTLEALEALFPHLLRSRVLVVLTARQEEMDANPPAARLIRLADKAGILRRLPLLPLSISETEELVAGVLGLDGSVGALPLKFLERLYYETRGNPLFVLQILSTLIQEGILRAADPHQRLENLVKMPLPVELSEAVLRRLSRLEPSARRALEMASVIGERFAFSLWADALGEDERKLLRTAHLLRKAGFLSEDRDAYRFGHELIRRIIYRSLGTRRKELHLRVAQVLEGSVNAGPEDLAWHYLSAEVWDKAFHYGMAAVSRFLDELAPQSALEYLEQVERACEAGNLGPDKRARMWHLRGLALALQERFDEAERAFSTMLKWAARSEDGSLAALAVKELATVAMRRGRWRRCRELAERALLAAQEAGDLALEAMAWDLLANVASIAGLYEEARKHRLRTLRLRRRLGNEKGYLLGIANLGADLLLSGRFKKALRVLNYCIPLLREAGLKLGEVKAVSNLGHVYTNLGDYDRAVQAFEDARRLASEAGLKGPPMEALVSEGFVFVLRGRRAQAMECFREAFERAGGESSAYIEATVRRCEALLTAYEGRAGEALKSLAIAFELARDAGLANLSAAALFTAALVRRYVGDFPRSEALLEEALRRAGEGSLPHGKALAEMGCTLAFTRPEEALTVLDKALALHRDIGDKLYVIRSLIGRAWAHRHLGRHREALSLARSAVEGAGQIGLVWEQAEGMLVLGLTQEALGRDSEAASTLARGLQVALDGGFSLISWRFRLALGRRYTKANRREEALLLWREGVREVQRLAANLERGGFPEARESLSRWQPVRELYSSLGCYGEPLRGKRVWVEMPAASGSGLTPVLWTVDSGEDDAAYAASEGPVRLRRRRILRLLAEAEAQGASPTEAHLAEALGVSARTIRSDISALRREGHRIRTAGQQGGRG